MKDGKKEFYFTEDEWDIVQGYIDEVEDAVGNLQSALNKATIAVPLNTEELEEDSFERRAREFRLTLRDWQLYSSKEGTPEAVIALNAALKSVCFHTKDDYVARDIMYGIMDRYARLGARDTEPEYCLVEALQIIYNNPQLER